MIPHWEVQQNSSPAGAISVRNRRPSLRRYLATSPNPLPRLIRQGYAALNSFSVPAPALFARPILRLFLTLRASYQFLVRVFICEPMFKAYCKKYGRHLHTDCHLHWIQGRGDIVIGDDVWVDGKISITFAARFADHPLFEIGDNSRIGHNCDFRIGKRISIGRNCNPSGNILIMDSNGHPASPEPDAMCARRDMGRCVDRLAMHHFPERPDWQSFEAVCLPTALQLATQQN